MAVDDPEKIDIISERNNGDVVLTISDHLDWADSKAHQLILQETLNAYLRFIESGEIHEHLAQSTGKRIVINVVGRVEPDAEGKRFLEKAGSIVEGAGFGFEHRVLP